MKGMFVMVLLTIVVSGAILIFGDSGYMHSSKLEHELAQLEARAAQIQADNAQLAQDIYKMTDDLDAIEAQARKFGMVKKDEIILQMNESYCPPLTEEP